MRLIIEGKTNRDDVMVNTAKVTLPSGDVYTIDRDCTEYTISTVTGYLSMTWDMCYLHMINDILLFDNTAYLSSDDGFQDILNEGTLELELEDDAFQYISCYSLSKCRFIFVIECRTFQYISCYSLSCQMKK